MGSGRRGHGSRLPRGLSQVGEGLARTSVRPAHAPGHTRSRSEEEDAVATLVDDRVYFEGHDRSAVVQSARNSPDGRTIYLGDLIAWPWRDPGPVPLKQRVGCCAVWGRTAARLACRVGSIICSGKGRYSSFVTRFPLPSSTTPDPPFRSTWMAFATFGSSIRRTSMTGSRASRACPRPFLSQMRALAIE
jgi:hypothetical protein